MKVLILSFCAATLLLNSCNNNTSQSPIADTTKKMGDEKMAITTPPLDSATMAKNWQDYMTPSAVHKMLASWDGNWQADVLMWQVPDAPPQKSTMTTTNKMVLGGRYQLSENKGNMMGMPFDGMGTLAYDNAKKEFISTWIDNMGTGLAIAQGTWDEAKKTINLTGKMVDPSSGTGKEVNFKQNFILTDSNHQTMQMFTNAPNGKEFKSMEINYTRKK